MGFKNTMSNSEPDEDIELHVEDLELVDDEEMVDIVEEDLDDDNDNVSIDSEEVVPEFDNSICTFRLHEGPVYSCSAHPNGRIVASGCEGELLYVWDCCSNQVLLKENFQDSVTLVKFNYDGKYLAAIDMLGNFGCWKYLNNSFTKIKTMKWNGPSWMEWHPLANVLFLAEETNFCMWKVPKFDENAKFFTMDCYSQAGCLLPDGKNILIGYDEGHAVILDLSSFSVAAKLNYPSSDGADHKVVAVAAHPNNNVVALGSENGRVILFTTRKPKVIGALEIPKVDDQNYIEGLKFICDRVLDLLLVAFSKRLNVYDQSKLILRHQLELNSYSTRFVCAEPYVCLANVNAMIEIFDCRNGERKATLQGHSKAIMDLTLSHDKKRLFTASDDNTVKIFNLDFLF